MAGKTMKILAVDDEDIALDLLASVLAGGGYDDVTTARDARAALDRIDEATRPFDCILLDIRMPGMDGIELCAAIRARPGYDTIPIIMITAVIDQGRLDQAIAAGATDYVNKPLNGLELGARLRAARILCDLVRERARAPAPEADAPAQKGGLRPGDPIPLDPAEGVVSLTQLENGLLNLPSGPYLIRPFAFAIAEIEALFDAMPADRFRALLNQVAARALAACEELNLNIAYAGNGVFAVVLYNARAVPLAGVKAAICAAVQRADYDGMEAGAPALRLAFGQSRETTIWTGASAALALAGVCRKARDRARTEAAESGLTGLRRDIRGLAPSPDDSRWLVRKLKRLELAVGAVRPRRVVTREE